jgi:hypothetical protein
MFDNIVGIPIAGVDIFDVNDYTNPDFVNDGICLVHFILSREITTHGTP